VKIIANIYSNIFYSGIEKTEENQIGIHVNRHTKQ